MTPSRRFRLAEDTRFLCVSSSCCPPCLFHSCKQRAKWGTSVTNTQVQIGCQYLLPFHTRLTLHSFCCSCLIMEITSTWLSIPFTNSTSAKQKKKSWHKTRAEGAVGRGSCWPFQNKIVIARIRSPRSGRREPSKAQNAGGSNNWKLGARDHLASATGNGTEVLQDENSGSSSGSCSGWNQPLRIYSGKK